MYARHDLIIKSACLWLEDVNSIQRRANSLTASSPAESLHDEELLGADETEMLGSPFEVCLARCGFVNPKPYFLNHS